MNNKNMVVARFQMACLPNVLRPLYLEMIIGQVSIPEFSGKGPSKYKQAQLLLLMLSWTS